MNLQFLDKNNEPLKEGTISFDGSKPELLYKCDINGYEGLGVNASRHVGSELYPPRVSL